MGNIALTADTEKKIHKHKMGNIELTALLSILLVSIFEISSALDTSLQIVAPERHSFKTLQTAMFQGILDANLDIEADIFYIDKEFPSPSEISAFYCEGVFLKNASVIMNINYNELLSFAMDYIVRVAQGLGIPVISWDPFRPGALLVS